MEGYVLVDNGRLTEKEARMNMEQCADFLARMIQKYGPEILDDITSEKDGISFVLVYKLSRFGRNAADVLKSMQLLMDYPFIRRMLKLK